MNLVSKKIVAVLSSLAILAGCSSAPAPEVKNNDSKLDVQNAAPKADNEIFIFTVWPAQYVNPDLFEREVGQHIKRKFPNIKLKQVGWDDRRRYEDLIAAGTFPDIIMDNARMNLHRYIFNYELEYDIKELMKKHNFDTSRLDPGAFAQMQNMKPTGEIYGLPYQMGGYVMFYNIDIFDKFGAEYPTNGMTYDEIYELAKKMTRVDGENTYKGYAHHPGLYMTYNQRSLSPLHQFENRSLLTTDEWKVLVDNLRRFYEIPANQFTSVDHFPLGKMAMVTHVAGKMISWHEQNPNLNFDIVSMPSFVDKPGVMNMPDISSMYITKQSQNKDLAFQVVDYLLSDEFQTELSKNGMKPVINSEAAKQAFGQNLWHMQGKNLDAVFYGQHAMPPAARNDGLVYIDVPLHNVFSPHIFGESKDSITALRLVEEATNKGIQTKLAAGSE